jgi:hypothetical protein
MDTLRKTAIPSHVVQRDLGQGDKYEYDLAQEIKRFAQNGNVDLNNGMITTPQADTNMTFDGCGNQKSLNGGGTFQVDTLNEYTTYNGAAVGNDIAEMCRRTTAGPTPTTRKTGCAPRQIRQRM